MASVLPPVLNLQRDIGFPLFEIEFATAASFRCCSLSLSQTGQPTVKLPGLKLSVGFARMT
jgi:hypothetical protein